MKCKVTPQLTAAERKVINQKCNEEINRRLNNLTTYCDALMVLSWSRHLGWGKKRIINAWNAMRQDYFDFLRRYEMEGENAGWLLLERCRTELGIDIEDLEKQDVIQSKLNAGGVADEL